MRGINKSFAGVRVLDNVDFSLQRGEIHALVGGNGAGKSTLMKILEGVYTPDAGQILIDGQPVEIRSPQDARALGIGMVFQEFSLIPTLTVAENIFLTREPRGAGGLINDREAEERARALFAEMEERSIRKPSWGRLSTGYWQLTEIAKALAQNARILIMDEPTSTLTASETQSLFALVQKLEGERDLDHLHLPSHGGDLPDHRPRHRPARWA